MRIFKILQIVLIALGVLLVLGRDWLGMPDLLYGGLVCFGLAAMVMGCEAILTREITFGSRRRGSRQTYTGLPAVLQGIQFNLLGFFFIGLAVLMYFNLGRELVLKYTQRPGLPLLVIGGLLLLQALVAFVGYRELNQASGVFGMLNLFVSRALPGVILFVLGLAALAFGFLDLVAPTVFDGLGGGWLETMYGVR